jgi:hypothetical protein
MDRRESAMAIRTSTRSFLFVLTLVLAGCHGASSSLPTGPSTIQPDLTPRPSGHGEYIVDVTLSGVVYEVTPAGRVPIQGVSFYSSETAGGVTDINGVFKVKPVWVCPCDWSLSVEANMTAIRFEKAGYEDPPGLPKSLFDFTGGSNGFRDVKIQGDTTLEVELVRK